MATRRERSTGAQSQRRGVFELAHTGTLFLGNEIGELELSLQPKLLRAIERGEVQRVGASRWLKVDVRIVAATRRDLDREVQSGRFRDDLFYRLAVGRVELPPLRRRRGDVAILAHHFWAQVAGDKPMPPGLIARLEDYAWPGNVRELQNSILRHCALGELPSFEDATSDDDDALSIILTRDLPLPQARAQVVVEAFERRYVKRLLERHGGNVTRAAGGLRDWRCAIFSFSERATPSDVRFRATLRASSTWQRRARRETPNHYWHSLH